VTTWQLYDTAYTERHMQLDADLNASSVMSRAERFPDEFVHLV